MSTHFVKNRAVEFLEPNQLGMRGCVICQGTSELPERHMVILGVIPSNALTGPEHDAWMADDVGAIPSSIFETGICLDCARIVSTALATGARKP